MHSMFYKVEEFRKIVVSYQCQREVIQIKKLGVEEDWLINLQHGP